MKKSLLIINLIICSLTNYAQEAGTFKDPRDGKVYKTVKIGIQTWFAENLSFKPSTGNYWAYENEDSNVVKYGYFYKWETAKSACPTGWHLPSDAEWTILTNYLGGASVAGGKMKATTDWKYDVGGNATNESGFNALPTGRRNYDDGSFNFMGYYAFFWSRGEFACYQYIYYIYEWVGSDDYLRADGFNVRCLKD